MQIGHITVVCLVAWSLNENEAGVDLGLIETSLLFLCKFMLISMRAPSLALEKPGGFYQNENRPHPGQSVFQCLCGPISLNWANAQKRQFWNFQALQFTFKLLSSFSYQCYTYTVNVNCSLAFIQRLGN